MSFTTGPISEGNKLESIKNHENSYLRGTSCIYSTLASGGLYKCFQCYCVVDSTIMKKLLVIPYKSLKTALCITVTAVCA